MLTTRLILTSYIYVIEQTAGAIVGFNTLPDGIVVAGGAGTPTQGTTTITLSNTQGASCQAFYNDNTGSGTPAVSGITNNPAYVSTTLNNIASIACANPGDSTDFTVSATFNSITYNASGSVVNNQ